MIGVYYFIIAIIGYLLGSLNTSLLVSKLIYKKDIRNFGSKNAGATNTLRVLGKRAAILVVVGDALKGVLACLGGYLITNDLNGIALGGFMSVIGHNWPVYFGFRGGKGVLTTFAVVLCIQPVPALICLLIFIVIVAISGFVSLGSIVGAIVYPIVALLTKDNIIITEQWLYVVIVIVLPLLIIVRHHSNIGRLLKGEEKSIKSSRKKEGKKINES